MALSDIPPFPPTGHFINAVRESSRTAREAAGIKIDDAACERLLLSPTFTSSFRRLSKEHGYLFPVKFDSALTELNFLSVLSLLNFASGYRAPLHALTGRGAFDSIRALLLGLHIGGEDLLSARGMKDIDEAKIAGLMNLNIFAERPHERIPGVTVGERGGPAYEVVHLVTKAMQSTGEVLVNGGYPDLGTFIVEALRAGETARKSGGTEAELNVIVEQLVRAIPAFQDMAFVQGQPVYCFKKALLVLHGIHLRFASRDPSVFPVPNTSTLPIFSDNVIPSMCVHLGVLDLTKASLGLSSAFPDAGKAATLDALLSEHVTAENVDKAKAAGSHNTKPPVKDGPILTQEQAFALRASAIDVCEHLIRVAQNLDESKVPSELSWLRDITLPELDAWLWAVAKSRPDYRALDRFVLRNTTFF